MNGFYSITESIYAILKDKGFKVVSLGDSYKIDLLRQTIFPYAHIIPESSVKSGSVTEWTFTIVGMDIVDFNKDALRDLENPFYSNDNLQDVLNDVHNMLSQFMEQYERGTESGKLIKIVTDSTFTAFIQRGENLLAGWEIDITIEAPTGGSIC